MRGSTIRRRAVWGIALMSLWATPLPAAAGAVERVAREEEVRAAFLFQLAHYVEWPEGRGPASAASLRLCVVGDKAMGATIEPALRGKTLQGKRIEVVREAQPGQLGDCHVAFIGYTGERELRNFFGKWRDAPVLLVGQADGFAEMGGMVNLVIASGRVTFEVNLASVERARMSLRSQLLRFARLVAESKERAR